MKLLNINKNIIIGTAQLGTIYGIANKSNKIIIKDKIKLLNYCYNKGLKSIDTAYSYENSHQIIGQWIKNNKVYPKLSTKIPNLKKYNSNIYQKLIDIIFTELNIKKIENLFLHNPKDWKNSDLRKYIINILEKKLISKFGLSIYDKKDIYQDPEIKILQVPGNIFNQNIINSDEIKLFTENGGEVHIRSIFIQGLLLMNQNYVPKHLEQAKKGLVFYQNIANELKINKTHLAIMCMKYLLPKSKIVIGIDNISHINDLLKIEKSDFNKSDIKEILKMSTKYSGEIWDTRKW